MSAANPDGTGLKLPNHDFKKHFYFNTENKNCMAVYKGSLERVYRGRHGNTKFSDRIHYQTSQSVGQALRDAADQQKTAGQTLMDLRTRIPAGLMAHSYLPCNASQVTYQRSLAKKSHRLR